MKLVSWNVNGLRAAYTKGFLSWFEHEIADIVCLQEVKANYEQLPHELQKPNGYYTYFNSAQKKGYSGVAVYTKNKPISVNYVLNHKRFDEEGRMIHLFYPSFSLINLYIPNGGRQKENMTYKLEVYEKLYKYLKKFSSQPIILTGDFNIAHTENDLARPRDNQNNTMFTPTERGKIDMLISLGFTDTFRHFNKEGGQYTWWGYWANCRSRNIGWRIDYIFSSSAVKKLLTDACIENTVLGSDHCPIRTNFKL
ncbi:MAG: exodeoxyribonuclease III [bacterium]